MSVANNCPLCRQSSGFEALSALVTWPRILKCDRCGTFQVDEGFLMVAHHHSAFPLLSGLARERHEHAEQLKITIENYEELQRQAPITAMEKARKLLQAIAFKNQPMDQPVLLDPSSDYTLAYCISKGELSYILQGLHKFEWIETINQTHMASSKYAYRLTIKGWEEIDISRSSTSAQGFVAMWFDPKMFSFYVEGFDPAITAAGYKPFRIDNKEHNDKVDDLIIASIKESRFVVADFTGHRSGVYFEAGFALGLGLPVIWSCEKDQVEGLHFDIRQYNCVIWNNAPELLEKLTNRIRATIGTGPLKG